MNANENQEHATLCVVCPCYNEQEVLFEFYTELVRTLNALPVDGHIIFVDDGSKDQTLAVLDSLAEQDERVIVLSLSRNFGHQIALTAGLDHVSDDVDAVVMMDCDLQHPPDVIADFIDCWRKGADVVSAIRRQTEEASRIKRWSAAAFYYLINKASDTHIVPNAADFVLLSKQAREALQAMPERHRFLRGMISWIGFRREYIHFDAPPRAAGNSKYTMRKMVALARDAAFSFSSAPIRLASRLGAALATAGFLYLTYVVLRYLILRDLVPGWSSLICITLIVGGFQLFFLGLVGEYVARVFEESKGRPLYFVRSERRSRSRSSEHDALEVGNEFTK
ncbi:MAG: glycosyltransferase family 2 protein [Pseudomonadota bacterium]